MAPSPRDSLRRRQPPVLRRLGVALAAAALAAGCQAVTDPVYYGVLERFGSEKRHILAARVAEGREAQGEAKQQFRSALEAFQAVTDFEGGELEEVYEELEGEYEASEARAETVRERIGAIEAVAEDLFAEWRSELETMQEASLRARSAEKLRATEARYERLIASMRRAEERMEPVLVAFRDRVLYLKHNLNARAVASLRGDLGEIREDVDALVEDVNASVSEADEFLATMEGARAGA